MKESDHFEIQIKRIKELIESPGSEITWNDRINDPDNPKQSRQIDITIRKHNSITHVECRFHKSPQDVKWVKELLGRKMSLEADKMIAVSFSGFTEGARKKAAKWGIFLRDLYELTEEEIKEWGNNSTIRLGLYRYKNVVVTPLIDIKFKDEINPELIIAELAKYDHMFGWFEYVKSEVLQKAGKGIEFDQFKTIIDFQPGKFQLNGIPLTGAQIEAKITQDALVVKNSSVLLFGAPDESLKKRKARIDQFGFDGFEVTKANGKMSLCVDLSSVEFPEDCQFNGRLILNQEIGHEIDGVRFISLDQAQLKFSKLSFNVAFDYKN